MRLAVKREPVTTMTKAAASGETAAATETSFEVPNSTIAKLSGILAAVLTLSQILSTVVSSLTGAYSSRSQVEISKEVLGLVEDNFRVQLLQRVLEDTDEQRRAASLRLLLAAGLLKDADGRLTRLVETSGYAPPLWGPRPLEPLKDTLPLARGGAAPPGGTDNANRNTNTSGNKNSNTNSSNANNSNANNSNANAGG